MNKFITYDSPSGFASPKQHTQILTPSWRDVTHPIPDEKQLEKAFDLDDENESDKDNDKDNNNNINNNNNDNNDNYLPYQEENIINTDFFDNSNGSIGLRDSLLSPVEQRYPLFSNSISQTPISNEYDNNNNNNNNNTKARRHLSFKEIDVDNNNNNLSSQSYGNDESSSEEDTSDEFYDKIHT